MYRKITIYKTDQEIVNGKKREKEPVVYYEPSARITDLYSKEKYEAMEKKLDNTIVFEVRACKLVKEMRKHLKQFYVMYDNEKYEIFDANFKPRDDNYFLLKANGVT